jgi:putative nucleotidyltransferase-like protein
MRRPKNAVGQLVARIAAGAWRRDFSPLTVTLDEVHSVAPLLLSTGIAALAWHRMQSLDFPLTEPLLSLRDAYRKYLLDAVVNDWGVNDFFKRARAAELEPLLFKGWGIARLYPDSGLRPYGDFDLWVRPNDLDKLYGVIRSNNERYCVEPHISFYPQFERSFDDVMSRSKLIPLDNAQVRVPCDEDHLRFICLHFLFHGGWRPLWLCDVGLMVESAGSGFDWDRCLGGSRKHADWVACVIGLAHQLLGAEVAGAPVAKRAKSLPGWLTNAVLTQWAKGAGMSSAENLSFSFPRRLLKPSALVRSFREHWRNPIQASVEMNASFSDTPRGILQFSSLFRRFPDFVKYFGREIRRT